MDDLPSPSSLTLAGAPFVEKPQRRTTLQRTILKDLLAKLKSPHQTCLCGTKAFLGCRPIYLNETQDVCVGPRDDFGGLLLATGILAAGHTSCTE